MYTVYCFRIPYLHSHSLRSLKLKALTTQQDPPAVDAMQNRLQIVPLTRILARRRPCLGFRIRVQGLGLRIWDATSSFGCCFSLLRRLHICAVNKCSLESRFLIYLCVSFLTRSPVSIFVCVYTYTCRDIRMCIYVYILLVCVCVCSACLCVYIYISPQHVCS